MADQGTAEGLIVPLTASYTVEDFDCGDPVRNSWLCTRAFANQKSDDTRTYVALDGLHVSGFCALAVGSIMHSKLSAAMRRNAPDPVSCVLLAQLAVGVRYKGSGLDRRLVLHAMDRAVKVAEAAGCRLFAVHPDPAKPWLVDYYKKYEFQLVDTAPPLMVMALRKVRAILDAVNKVAGEASR